MHIQQISSGYISSPQTYLLAIIPSNNFPAPKTYILSYDQVSNTLAGLVSQSYDHYAMYVCHFDKGWVGGR